MADVTKIEWTHRPGTKGCTWNPIRARRVFEPAGNFGKLGWHCEHVSEACRNCYAERLNMKLGATGGTGLAYKPGHRLGDEPDVEVFLDETVLVRPGLWRAPRTIFVCSMTDLFADFVLDEWLDKIFAVAALCPQHTFIMLTKRPERMQAYLRHDEANLWQDLRMRWFRAGENICPDRAVPLHFIAQCRVYPLPNVWLGVTAEDQPNASERTAVLRQTPAAVRLVSCEPMVGLIDLSGMLSSWKDDPFTKDAFHSGHAPTPGLGGFVNWVICGGETGPNARPMHPNWARSLRDQCKTAGVPFFFKQWGEFSPDDSQIVGPQVVLDGGVRMRLIGKKRAGRLLDGIKHNDFPAR